MNIRLAKKDKINLMFDEQQIRFYLNPDWFKKQCLILADNDQTNADAIYENTDPDIENTIIRNAMFDIETSGLESDDIDMNMLLKSLNDIQNDFLNVNPGMELPRDMLQTIKITLVDEIFVENEQCFKITIDDKITVDYISAATAKLFLRGFIYGIGYASEKIEEEKV